MADATLPPNTTYLIVGGGPAGLALHCTLLNAGVPASSVLHVEKWMAPRPREQSRAAAIHARTLEVLADSVDDASTRPEDTSKVRGKSEGAAADPDPDAPVPAHLDSVVQFLIDNGRQCPATRLRHPGRAAPMLSIDFSRLDKTTQYPFINVISQTVTEEALAARLRTLGGTLHRGWTVEGFEERLDGEKKLYEAKITNAESGKKAIVMSKFMIGADGGHSIVRRTAGISFEGGEYPGSSVLADIKLKEDGWPWKASLKSDIGYDGHEFSVIFDQAGLLMFIPLPGTRLRMAATVAPSPASAQKDPRKLSEGGHTEDRTPPSVAEIAALLAARAPGRAPEIEQVFWSTRFHIAHKLAGAFRAGNVLLVGDAAHVHSPAGGQGMNTGIQDAVSLGLVLAGAREGEEALQRELDGWAARRLATAAQIVGVTDRMTRMSSITNPAAGWMRDRMLGVMSYVPGLSKKMAFQLAQLGLR